MPDAPSATTAGGAQAARPPCPAPAIFRHEAARYDAAAQTGLWIGPRYRMTYRILGEGPPLFLVPGIASTYQIYALLLNLLSRRFRTISYDYPGEHPDDGASISGITHENLVDDLFGLIDHLNIGRAFLAGLSFGSTVTLAALRREPRRFPRAAVQGAFARRRFSFAEKWALRLGRLFPGTLAGLPLQKQVLTYNSKPEFPAIFEDRWLFYLEKNGETPIRSLAHRVDLLTRLDLRPILREIPTELLLIQGNEDRIVSRRDFDELEAELPHAEGVILPTVGHVPHVTHAEGLARVIGDWLLPCPPAGCSEDNRGRSGCQEEGQSSPAQSE
jgi:pimeloyl-ACP methyl ester carboxylesterase